MNGTGDADDRDEPAPAAPALAVFPDPALILGPEGSLAKELTAYESRPQQLAMAAAVAEAIAVGSHAVVEAPTGVGKSFAYLVPAIQHALSLSLIHI